MTRCSTTSFMNSKLSMGFNKFRINAKLRKLRKKKMPSSDHLTNPRVTSRFGRALSHDGLSRNCLTTLPNYRTTVGLTNSRVMALQKSLNCRRKKIVKLHKPVYNTENLWTMHSPREDTQNLWTMLSPGKDTMQRGGKHAKRNTETCRVNTHSTSKCLEFIAKWEDRARHQPENLFN